MTESQSHKSAKKRAAGKSGNIEVPLPGGRRLDAATPKKAIEVEAKNLMEMYKIVVEQGNFDFTQLVEHIYCGDDVDVRSKSHISVSDAFIKKLRMLSCFAHSLLAASHATEGAAVKFNRDMNPDYHFLVQKLYKI